MTVRPLRVLMVEDDERDAQLLVLELRRGGFVVAHERVDTPEGMSAALARQPWDLIIADFGMPLFSAPRALALMKDRNLDLPFIIVSGTIGEDAAVVALRAGAHDFMTKGKLARLNPAVERELAEVKLRAERIEIREQLMIAERMASVGTLAAGVAHEINNPLAALMANIEFAIEDVGKLSRGIGAQAATGDPLRECEGRVRWILAQLQALVEPLMDARASAARVNSIVKDLKVFSRGGDEKEGPVDVRRVLESTLRMASNEIRHRARLVEDYGEVPPVEANEGRLGQVFLNLIVNATQAIAEGRANQNEIRITTRQDGADRVVVEVSDTGAGISASVLGKIFDPFFTTKSVGIGTGLGLSICNRIVTGLGGQISVESRVGKGTVIRTTLPVSRKSVRVATRPPPSLPGRRGRVLIVDDEPRVCKLVARMLSAEHDVVAVARGREVVERIAQGERFDVILCDLMMPELTGMEVRAELVSLAPDQANALVFMTGGAFTSAARELLAQASNPFLEKPFEAVRLRTLVRSLVSSRAPLSAELNLESNGGAASSSEIGV